MKKSGTILKEERKKEKKNKKESLLTGRRSKKPKGNGIKDGLARLLCVYAVVFGFFSGGLVGAGLNLLSLFIFKLVNLIYSEVIHFGKQFHHKIIY